MKGQRPTLEASSREITGRKVKKLRKEGILPVNLYGKKIKSVSLQLPVKEFLKVYDQVGESGLVDLKVDGEARPILIHNVHLHPVSDEPLHADLHQVSLTEKTTATVPIELEGEAPAVAEKLGILIQPLGEVEVEALPQDLPESLTVDISALANVGDAVTVADIKVDSKIEVKAVPEEVVAKIDELAEEIVEPEPEAEEGAEGEAVEGAEGEATEGETPAEGGESSEGGENNEE